MKIVKRICSLFRKPKKKVSHKDFRIASQERFINHLAKTQKEFVESLVEIEKEKE